jgi:hypothetical protein
MPDAPAPRPSVTAWGIVRGRELQGAAVVELDAGDVVLVGDAVRPLSSNGRLAFAISSLYGARADGEQLTLFLRGGDVLELSGPKLAPLGEALMREARELPEQTLRLRHFGASKSNPGSDHDRFFGPLLAARRRAGAATTIDEQLEAFDATSLQAEFERTLRAFAADRYRREGPDRRALEAELFELAEPLLAAVNSLGNAALAVRAAPGDATFIRWREWAAAAQRVFAEADRWWAAALAPLANSRGRAGRFWRRLLGRGR